MSRIRFIGTLLAASLGAAAACSDSIPTSSAGESLPATAVPSTSNGVVSSINVFLGTTSLNAGSTTKATYEYVDSNDQVVSPSSVGAPGFSSDNPTVATVSSTGVVTGVGNGTAHILVTKNNITGKSPTLTVKGAITSTATVASVTVQLNASSLTVGQTTQASATQKDSVGNVLAGRGVTWKSSNTAVATVSTSGLVSAVGTGSAAISATSTNGKSGIATLSVAASTQAAVASVSVSLASSSIAVGATTQASATTRDSSGAALTGRSITWSSDNPSIATVSTAGLVTAVAAGSAHISATSEGKSGSATLTVTAPPPPTGTTAECAAARPEWIFCDDFETDRTAKYFEYDNAGGAFTRVAGAGKDGSAGMRVTFAAGQVAAGSLKLAFGKVPSSSFKPVDAGTAIYRDIYWRMYLKDQAGWTGGGGDKLSRAMSLAGPNWQQAMIAHVWSGGSAATQNYLLAEPASGTDAQGNLMTTQYNDFANLRWLGPAQSTMPVFDAAHVGQWHCIEAHARLNDAGSANGVEELFIDGTLQAQRTGLNFVGAFAAYGINAVFFESYWNAGSPVAQSRYFDNIVVSTKPIGC